MKRTTLALLAALLIGACVHGTPFEPMAEGIPADAYRIEALPVYAQWFAEVQACSGRSGDFSRLRFWAVPRSSWSGPDGGIYLGMEYQGNIYVPYDALGWPEIFKHEMLHALGYGNDHPPFPFDTCVYTRVFDPSA